MSTAFYLQTDGQTKILNQIVKNYLRAFTNLEDIDQANLLLTAAFAYNNSYNYTLKTTLFRVIYRYNPDFYIDVADNVSQERVLAAKERILKLQELREKLRDQWIRAQERQQKYYNQRHQEIEFKRGDVVKLSTRNLRLKNKKLQPRYIGPFRVTERIRSQAYHIALLNQYQRLYDVFPI